MALRNTAEKIRVFIGTEPKTEIARKVLQCSIERRTDMKVEFIPMIGNEWEYSTQGFKTGTGFSLRRWMIPAFCKWEGRAIYLDADQLVYGDIWDLWTKPEQLPSTDHACSTWLTYQADKFSAVPWPITSVMVIDCALAKQQWGWHLPMVLKYLKNKSDWGTYQRFMHADWMTPKPAKIETSWNRLHEFQRNDTKLLHFTNEPEQPWYKPDHELAMLWTLELSVATNTGYVTNDDLKAALAKWQVQEDHRVSNGLHPDYARFIDEKRHRNGTAKVNRPSSIVAHHHPRPRKGHPA